MWQALIWTNANSIHWRIYAVPGGDESTDWGLDKGAAILQTIFKCILLNENVSMLLKISLKFVRNVTINNIPALVQIMACCRPGGNPLSEAVMVRLLRHICINQNNHESHTVISYNSKFVIKIRKLSHHGSLARYVKLRVAHAPGMPGTHHGTCVTHVLWCSSRSLTGGGGENVPGIPGVCATRHFTYPAKDLVCADSALFFCTK